MEHSDYWIECLRQSLEEHGVDAWPEQIVKIAKDVRGAHENFGQAFHTPSFSEHPVCIENAALKKQLAAERSKQFCPECYGRGRVYSQGPHHGSLSSCVRCNGAGKVYKP